jgi:hypothetical protein
MVQFSTPCGPVVPIMPPGARAWHLLVGLGGHEGHQAFGDVASLGADLPLVVGFDQEVFGNE